MAIITGKTWDNTAKKSLYLIFVDFDNQKAIEEFCSKNDVLMPLPDVAKTLIVEQHTDQPDKAHIIFYATHPFCKKSNDVVALSSELIPAIEVKGSGEHGLLFCTPSPHKNGSHYEIIEGGTLEAVDLEHIDSICTNMESRILTVTGILSHLPPWLTYTKKVE